MYFVIHSALLILQRINASSSSSSSSRVDPDIGLGGAGARGVERKDRGAEGGGVEEGVQRVLIDSDG